MEYTHHRGSQVNRELVLAVVASVLLLASMLLPLLPLPIQADVIKHEPRPTPVLLPVQKTVTALPTLTASKLPVHVGWEQQGDTYIGLRNLFGITVTPKGDAILTCTNDQPWGAKTGDTLTWHPDLYADDGIVYPAEPTLLAVDPFNPNYRYNTLEWNYGIAKRWLRLIEGRVIERWVFYEDPKADIRIRYNQSGNFKLRLGIGRDSRGFPVEVKVIDDDTEFVGREAFRDAVNYPVFIADSATFYPDANPETATVDGYVADVRGGAPVIWDTMHDATGDYNDDHSSAEFASIIWAGTDANEWKYLGRAILLFDTSSIPDDATIDSATLSVRGWDKLDALSISPTINVYEGDTASNDDLVDGDYNRVLDSTTAFSSAITYAAFDTSDYNDFTLNASGLANINKSGVSKFCLREATYDVADVEPAHTSDVASYFSIYYAEQGVGYLPKLVVNYTPVAVTVPTVTTLAATNVATTTATLHGRLDDDGGDENCYMRFQYYEPGDDWASGDATEWDSGFSSDDTHFENLSGLTPSTLYTFRLQADNDTGVGNGTALTFTTEASVGNPSDLVIYNLPTEPSLVLSWTKGSGSTDTVVRYQEGSYPGNYSLGLSGGSPTTGSLKIIGLDAGTTYYFRLWGHSGGNYSASYVEGMGTVSAAEGDDDPDAPDTPGLWFISTDYTRFDDMPLYTQINAFIDSLSIPRGTGWFLGALLLCGAVSLAVLARSKSGTAALIVFAIALTVCCVLRLLPLWMVAFAFLAFVGAGKIVTDQRRAYS